jgi:carbamoyltransferase
VPLKSEEELLDRATEDLLVGKVIGWSQGRFEWGPRALGHRSILADPRRAETRDLVNTKIKLRETFRPFAPSLTAESSARYFEQPLDRQPTAKFMLRTAAVRGGVRGEIPAVTHVDGSARPHLVEREMNPLYFDLIRRFGDASGHPVVLNTSFNLRGEPIVASAADALSTFFRSGLDVLYLENYRVAKQGSGS